MVSPFFVLGLMIGLYSNRSYFDLDFDFKD